MIVLIESTLTAIEREQTLSKLRDWSGANAYSIGGYGPGWGDCVELKETPEATLPEPGTYSEVELIKGVASVLTSGQPFRHVALGNGPAEGSRIEVGPAAFGAGAVSVIAGPCSVESLDDLLALAHSLRESGATALRGGAFKPRTSPYSFQGLGLPGLEILATVRAETGMSVITEVMDTREVELVSAYADMLQIGSRNMMNYALLREAGAAGKPVLLKRGMSATLSEFLFAAEYLAHAGCSDIVLCERGLRHFDPTVRNLLDLSAIPALKQRTHLPVVVDPSHGTGDASLVPPMLAAAAAAGADGFMVEVHPSPSSSVSDPKQALTPQEFCTALDTTRAVLHAIGRSLNTVQAATHIL